MFFRPNKIQHSVGNPQRAIELLKWSKPTDIDGVIQKMSAAQAKNLGFKPNPVATIDVYLQTLVMSLWQASNTSVTVGESCKSP